ncbi:molybdopterin-dependent oxidoreductase [Anaerosinus massiliensis]|uniref:molybdopterin-dependent oxidoreductase n=1 Tax=Massilibacillus massiliensis TaxID=1806837 RepID=UPI000AD78DC0|nr:molybdopterin-dependent oxidoreductase [Massilibacillus massiliensis]
MKFSRREFLKAMAVSSALFSAGCAMDTSRKTQGPTSQQDVEKWHKGVCRYCGTGCGVLAGVSKGKIVAVKGDPDCAVNKGRLCVKGILLPKIMDTKDRVLHPLIKKNGEFVKASWEEVLDLIATKFKSSIDEFGPDAVGFYGSGQNVAEEAYIANKLFKGAIGTNNIDGNPRTCMASAVAGYISTFGKDEPMGTYADIEAADVFFIIGSNLAEAHPILYSRVVDRKNSNPNAKIIIADPRRTRTADIADVLLQFTPGTDLALLNSMAYVIVEEDLVDMNFINEHTEFVKGADQKLNFAEFKRFLQDYAPEKVSELTGIDAGEIKNVARLFAAKDRNTISLWCMGLNQRIRGTWVNNLIHNLHLLTGKICRPGNTPFSLTGQPSACGSIREVGALSHLLPAHRVVANPKHRAEIAKIWGVDPNHMSAKPGYHTIEMFRAAAAGKLKALWVMCTNPGQSLPNLNAYRKGMEDTFMVVSETYHPTRTSELADVVLPAALWMEKEGVYGNGERRTQHLDKAVEPPGEAKPDVWALLEVAKRLGYGEIFNYKDNEAIWEEYRKCTTGTKMDLPPYARLKKEHGLTWPIPKDDAPPTAIRYAAPYDPFVPEGIKFYGRPNGRAVIYARPHAAPQEVPDGEYPFFLSTGRILEHWHTGTMTFNVPELKRAAAEMYIEICPEDAARLAIKDGMLVDVTSRRGTCKLKAKINGRGQPRPGMVYVPFHDQEMIRMINFVTIDAFDDVSKQPEYKLCAVKISRA